METVGSGSAAHPGDAAHRLLMEVVLQHLGALPYEAGTPRDSPEPMREGVVPLSFVSKREPPTTTKATGAEGRPAGVPSVRSVEIDHVASCGWLYATPCPRCTALEDPAC